MFFSNVINTNKGVMSSVVEWIMLVSRGYTVLVSALELIIVSGTVVKHSETLELLLDLDEFKPFFFRRLSSLF